MGVLQSMMQRLVVAVALVCALPLAGPGTSYAAPPQPPKTGYVNGQPCGRFCKSYMAWSDWVMARFRPPQPQQRVVVRPRKPDPTIHRASVTRQSNLDVFAQLRRSEASPGPVETPHAQAAPSEPVQPITERPFPRTEQPFPRDEMVAAKPADAGGATSEAPESTLVAVSGLASDTPDTAAVSPVARGFNGRFAVALGLSLCALLSLLAWAYFRGWLTRPLQFLEARRRALRWPLRKLSWSALAAHRFPRRLRSSIDTARKAASLYLGRQSA